MKNFAKMRDIALKEINHIKNVIIETENINEPLEDFLKKSLDSWHEATDELMYDYKHYAIMKVRVEIMEEQSMMTSEEAEAHIKSINNVLSQINDILCLMKSTINTIQELVKETF